MVAQGKQVDLTRLFRPRHIAVVGASPHRVRGRFDYVDYLTQADFPGKLYPVNPRHQEVKGFRCYPSIRDLPGPVDMAILMIPATKVIQVLRDTPSGKLKFALVITSGFSETGETDLESELIRVARERGIRLVGPNCMGIYSRMGRVASAFWQPFGPEPGELGVVSQSGGHSLNFVRATLESGIHIKASVSIGNQCDLTMEDFFAWYAQDPQVKAIAAYMEDLKQASTFPALARKITATKPLIIWKGGVTEQGARAAASHTGALAPSQKLWEGLVRQTGILTVDRLFEIPALCRALMWTPLPQGPGVGIVVPGGGVSVNITDECIRRGLQVPTVSEATQQRLGEFIPDVNTILTNPVDMGAAAYHPEALQKTLQALAREKDIHAFVFYLFIYPYKGEGGRESVPIFIETIKRVQASISQPIYALLYDPFRHFAEADETRREAVALMNKEKVPYFTRLDLCIKAIKSAWDYAHYLRSRGISVR